MNGDLRIRHLLEDAIRPSEAELVRVRGLLLEHLASGTVKSLEHLVEVVYRDAGVAEQPSREAYVDLGPVQREQAAAFDRDDLLIKRERLRSAVYEAVAQLKAEGILLPADPGRSEILITAGFFTGGSGSKGGERVTTERPIVDSGYKLSSRWAGAPAVTEISTILDAAGLEPLLGRRGMRCWQEAVAAFNRGLYLAAAGMVGAASEAAWYSLGEAITDDTRLAKHVEADNTVQVIKLAAERLKKARRSETTVDEIQVHAIYLRNYGLHPRSDDDAAREAAFTETGCLALLTQSRRYLARLLEVARSAEIVPA